MFPLAFAPDAIPLRTWQLEGGLSAEMTAVELAHPDGRTQTVIVRRTETAVAEFKLLKITEKLGLPTPKALHYDAAELVLEFIEGEMVFRPVHVGSYLEQFADQLVQIHAADLSPYDLAFLPTVSLRCAELARPLPPALNASMAEGRLRAVLHATQLTQRNPSVLLHGDYWPGNTLWRDGSLAAVIDWEDARLGDPLLDLANTRQELSWIFGPEAVMAFTQRYLAARPLDTSNLAACDLCAALRFVRLAGADLAGWAAYFGPYGRDDITAESIRHSHGWFVAQACNKLALS